MFMMASVAVFALLRGASFRFTQNGTIRVFGPTLIPNSDHLVSTNVTDGASGNLLSSMRFIIFRETRTPNRSPRSTIDTSC